MIFILKTTFTIDVSINDSCIQRNKEYYDSQPMSGLKQGFALMKKLNYDNDIIMFPFCKTESGFRFAMMLVHCSGHGLSKTDSRNGTPKSETT